MFSPKATYLISFFLMIGSLHLSAAQDFCALYPCTNVPWCQANRPASCDQPNNQQEPATTTQTAPTPAPTFSTAPVDPCDFADIGFAFFPRKDSPAGDINSTPFSDKDNIELAMDCLADDNCQGFNTNGWLKNTIVDTFIDASDEYDGECTGLYVRLPDGTRLR